MSELSPSTQAVLDAFGNSLKTEQYITSGRIEIAIAAAIRAAADQMSSHHSKSFLYSIADVLKLQTIATELEAQ